MARVRSGGGVTDPRSDCVRSERVCDRHGDRTVSDPAGPGNRHRGRTPVPISPRSHAHGRTRARYGPRPRIHKALGRAAPKLTGVTLARAQAALAPQQDQHLHMPQDRAAKHPQHAISALHKSCSHRQGSGITGSGWRLFQKSKESGRSSSSSPTLIIPHLPTTIPVFLLQSIIDQANKDKEALEAAEKAAAEKAAAEQAAKEEASKTSEGEDGKAEEQGDAKAPVAGDSNAPEGDNPKEKGSDPPPGDAK